MSFTKTKYDNCFLSQQEQSNKSIFNYVVDQSMFVNNAECNNYTAPFLTYIPSGIPLTGNIVDIENDLKGMNRPYSKCATCKFNPDPNTPVIQGQTQKMDVYPNNKRECPPQYNILPGGYYNQK